MFFLIVRVYFFLQVHCDQCGGASTTHARLQGRAGCGSGRMTRVHGRHMTQKWELPSRQHVSASNLGWTWRRSASAILSIYRAWPRSTGRHSVGAVSKDAVTWPTRSSQALCPSLMPGHPMVVQHTREWVCLELEEEMVARTLVEPFLLQPSLLLVSLAHVSSVCWSWVSKQQAWPRLWVGNQCLCPDRGAQKLPSGPTRTHSLCHTGTPQQPEGLHTHCPCWTRPRPPCLFPLLVLLPLLFLRLLHLPRLLMLPLHQIRHRPVPSSPQLPPVPQPPRPESWVLCLQQPVPPQCHPVPASQASAVLHCRGLPWHSHGHLSPLGEFPQQQLPYTLSLLKCYNWQAQHLCSLAFLLCTDILRSFLNIRSVMVCFCVYRISLNCSIHGIKLMLTRSSINWPITMVSFVVWLTALFMQCNLKTQLKFSL